MVLEGNMSADIPSQNSTECHRGGITHDQVYTDRQTGRVVTRSVPECVTVNGDIYLGDNPNSQRQVARIDRADERYVENRLSPGAAQYGDNYTGSAARIAELERQNYYLQQQLQQRSQMQMAPEYAVQQRQYGINPIQLAGASIGGLIGYEAMHHRGYGGYRHGGIGGGPLGLLAGSLIGGAIAGQNGYPTEYMAAPPVMMGWNNPGQYHYRHESPMQIYQQQRNMQMMRERQALMSQSAYYTAGNTYANYGDSDFYSYS
jgi:hypothetical protein